jgi:hypothetical protein
MVHIDKAGVLGKGEDPPTGAAGHSRARRLGEVVSPWGARGKPAALWLLLERTAYL